MTDGSSVLIEAALNGGRDRSENPMVPYTPVEVAVEARRSAEAGAAVVHLHARDPDGGWSATPARYAETLHRVRDAAPQVLVSITSLRPADVPVKVVLDLLDALAADPTTRPDLVSVNLGHTVVWEKAAVVSPHPLPSGAKPVVAPERSKEAAEGPRWVRRRTVHFPNDYDDVAALLAACRAHGIVPELGLMDLGFVSNAVALRDDGLLQEPGWFLVELDSPGYGAGPQVAPATPANYDALVAPLRRYFPRAAWAAHGQDSAGYAVLRHALVDGAHVRVGFEDAIVLPDGRPAASNADLVAWAVAAAREARREPATAAEARAITGCPPAT